jgi:hypothetical protein
MAMSHSSERGPTEVALSPAEAVYLRRFVRRHALSGPVGAALAAALLLALGLALRAARVDERPAPADPGSTARIEAIGGELAALRADLATRREPSGDAQGIDAVGELARRIDEISREIDALRVRFEAERPASPSRPAPVVGPAPPRGLEELAQRLFNVEARQSQAESQRSQVESDLLARLLGVETRQEEGERRDATALRSMLERVDRLETTRHASERLRLDGQNAIQARLSVLESQVQSAPAAPRPGPN